MSTATSSSDRYAEARAALRTFDHLSEWNAPEQWAESAHDLAAALRAVIELEAAEAADDYRQLPIHRTEAGYPNCATCDGGGCLDCTDPAY